MPSFNKIVLVGHLGRDPESKFTPQGTQVCSFSVATTEKRKDRDDVTTWFRVSVFGKQAEACQEYLTKGALVYVEGRLRLEEYTDREGNKRSSLEVSATDVKFLNTRERAAGAGAGESNVDGNDEIPF